MATKKVEKTPAGEVGIALMPEDFNWTPELLQYDKLLLDNFCGMENDNSYKQILQRQEIRVVLRDDTRKSTGHKMLYEWHEKNSKNIA